MDIADISKVAHRKRLNSDAEKLREKMARESSKIIKIKVAQDTAYWDLKERLQSVESAHERLQQNMLDVQMQHETLSARYQDELRLRPETANKVASTREICSALETHANCLRASVNRVNVDGNSLVATYADAARKVQRAHDTHARAAENARANITSLKEQLARSEEIVARLEETVREERRRCDQAVGEASALARDFAERNERRDKILNEKEQIIAILRSEKDQLAGEARVEQERVRFTIANLEQELKKRDEELGAATRDAEQARVDGERLRQTIANLERELQQRDDKLAAAARESEKLRAGGETACLTILNLERELQERDGSLAAAARDADKARVDVEQACMTIANLERELREREERLSAAAWDLEQARADGERASLTIANLERELQERDKRLTAAAEELEAKDQRITRDAEQARTEGERMRTAIAKLEHEVRERDGRLAAAAEDVEKAHTEIVAKEHCIARDAEETKLLQNQVQNLEKNITELEHKMEAVVLENEKLKDKIKDKDREAIERAEMVAADRQALEVARDNALAKLQRAEELVRTNDELLKERAETIRRLIHEVATETKAREHSDSALETEKKARSAADEKVRSLQDQLKGQEEQLSRHLTVILETRNEKERLQDIIGDMQSTIDNVQKELTRKQTKTIEKSRREPPEHDDNAVPGPPEPRGHVADRGVFRKPKPRADDLLYNFLSDSSTDADTFDQKAVNARFEALARGEMLPSGAASLSALKRRRNERGDHPQQATANRDADADLSLSQVRTNIQARARTFFKNKRPEAKHRNTKM